MFLPKNDVLYVFYGVVVHMRENSVKYGHNFNLNPLRLYTMDRASWRVRVCGVLTVLGEAPRLVGEAEYSTDEVTAAWFQVQPLPWSRILLASACLLYGAAGRRCPKQVKRRRSCSTARAAAWPPRRAA